MPRPRCCRAWRGSSCCTCRIAVRRRRCWTSWPATAGRSIFLGCCRPVARGIPVSPDLIADRARRAAELPRDHADAPAVTLPQLDDHTVHSRQPSSLNCHCTTVNLPGERSCSLRMLNPPRLVNSRWSVNGGAKIGHWSGGVTLLRAWADRLRLHRACLQQSAHPDRGRRTRGLWRLAGAKYPPSHAAARPGTGCRSAALPRRGAGSAGGAAADAADLPRRYARPPHPGGRVLGSVAGHRHRPRQTGRGGLAARLRR